MDSLHVSKPAYPKVDVFQTHV